MRNGLVLALIAAVFLVGLRSQQARFSEGAAAAELRPILRLGDWRVGELGENGLRIIATGPDDGVAVMDPDQFSDPQVRNAYRIAKEIPEIMNQLYCWCGCVNRGIHRSALACFEDRMGTSCDVCVGTAEIAWDMVQKGVTDAGRIQAAVDAVWAPSGG